MPPFPGVDFLEFDSLLSNEEKLARQTARRFVDEQILPIIEEHNREGKFPKQLVPQMAHLGLFGASLNGYGCAGMSNVEYGLVMQEIERGDSALRSWLRGSLRSGSKVMKLESLSHAVGRSWPGAGSKY